MVSLKTTRDASAQVMEYMPAVRFNRSSIAAVVASIDGRTYIIIFISGHGIQAFI